jgi:hypothetical protein
MNFGHASPIGVIPAGALAEIDCAKKTVTILESATAPRTDGKPRRNLFDFGFLCIIMRADATKETDERTIQMKLFPGKHHPRLMAIDFFKYIGPGLLVTVGFIDPGNWASQHRGRGRTSAMCFYGW